MGRNILKWATSAAAFILVLVGGSILSQGLDGLAEAAGVKTVAGGVFRYVSALGVGSWLLFAGAFLGGVAICLHGERFLRVLRDRRTAHDCARILFEFDDEGRAKTYSDKSGTIFGMVIDGQMHGRIHESERSRLAIPHGMKAFDSMTKAGTSVRLSRSAPKSGLTAIGQFQPLLLPRIWLSSSSLKAG